MHAPGNDRVSLYSEASTSSYDRSSIQTFATYGSVASDASGTTQASDADYDTDDSWRLFSVLCFYDFDSDDPDHLSFRKNELLDVVKQESSGWWAALGRNGGNVGWIPSAYVAQLTDEMAETLAGMREEIRVFEYEAEQLYNSAPTTTLNHLYSPDAPASSPDYTPKAAPTDLGRKISLEPNRWPSEQNPNRLNGAPPNSDRYPLVPQSFPRRGSEPAIHKTQTQSGLRTRYLGAYSPIEEQSMPPSPDAPMPHPRPMTFRTAPHSAMAFNKPTPPTPKTPASPYTNPPASADGTSFLSRGNSLLNSLRPAQPRRRPSNMSVDGTSQRISTLNEALASQARGIDETIILRTPKPNKVRQLTGDVNAERFANVKAAQAIAPWYLQPAHGEDYIKVDVDGSVKAGTLPALVERLTVEPLSLATQKKFQHAFLTTFRTFTTAETVFEMLVASYQSEHPPGLTEEEFDEWRDKKLRPTQERVLTVFTMWLEDHHLLEMDAEVAPKLQEFLQLIVSSPSSLATAAKLIQQSLERLTFAPSSQEAAMTSPAKKRKQPKNNIKGDLLKIDPMVLAQQLCLVEYVLYAKMKPQQCLTWAKTQMGRGVASIIQFSATHDKLAGWVKMSILSNDGLNRRADTVDFWIKCAEKCRALNNLSSLCAIVGGLTSAVVSRLYLTWAHVSRNSHLEPLVKLNEPTANFSAYRTLLSGIDGPCVPFIGMYLSDIVHINDQHPDSVPVQGAEPPRELIQFVKRSKWYDAVTSILRFQGKQFPFAEDPTLMSFIQAELAKAHGRDQGWYWTRSQELQHAELAHADIRKGLEAAGF